MAHDQKRADGIIRAMKRDRRARQRQDPLHCRRCDYRWFPYGDPPASCPNCFSSRWHTDEPYDPKAPRRKRRRQDPAD